MIFCYFFVRLENGGSLFVKLSISSAAGKWCDLYDHFRNPATFLHAYTCLPLAYPTRQAAGAILQDVADSGVLFAILMSRHKVDPLLNFKFYNILILNNIFKIESR